MTRTTRNPLTVSGMPSPAQSQEAGELIRHRAAVYAIAKGSPVLIRRPGRADVHGAVMVQGNWSRLESIVRTAKGELVRIDWRHVHPADPTAAPGEAEA